MKHKIGDIFVDLRYKDIWIIVSYGVKLDKFELNKYNYYNCYPLNREAKEYHAKHKCKAHTFIWYDFPWAIQLK